MSLIKTALSNITELSKSTTGKIELEWNQNKNKESQLFECFRELFDKLYNDKVKKFTVTIGGSSFSIDKETFYTNYKNLKETVVNNVEKYYPKTNSHENSKEVAATPTVNG